MSEGTPSVEQSQSALDFASQLIQKGSKVYLGVGQEFVFTTEDKIRLCLNRHLSRMGKRRAWIAPAGILLTILVVFATTQFRNFGLRAETWQAMFIISALLCFGWFARSIWEARVSTSLEDVVAELKQTALMPEKPETGSEQARADNAPITGRYFKTTQR